MKSRPARWVVAHVQAEVELVVWRLAYTLTRPL